MHTTLIVILLIVALLACCLGAAYEAYLRYQAEGEISDWEDRHHSLLHRLRRVIDESDHRYEIEIKDWGPDFADAESQERELSGLSEDLDVLGRWRWVVYHADQKFAAVLLDRPYIKSEAVVMLGNSKTAYSAILDAAAAAERHSVALHNVKVPPLAISFDMSGRSR